MKDRLFNIKEFINKTGKVTIKELACAFPDVSEMTLRRDLERLEKNNEILRVTGGAMSIDSVMRTSDSEVSKRIGFNADEKLEIAEKAIGLISRGSCIFIDGGSTTTYFARALPDEKYYILTNSVVVAETALHKIMPTVALLGGDIRKRNFITVGETCLEHVRSVNIQTAIMTATGFIKETGAFTCGDQSEAQVKMEVIKKADQVIMLLDTSKVNKKTPYTFCTLCDVDCMVTDSKFSKELKTQIEQKGIKVY